MKNSLTLFLLIFLVFFGCNQESEITSPINNSTNNELKLLSLPRPASGLSVEDEYTVSMIISGGKGGVFSADYSYQGNNGTVYQISILEFEGGSFYSTKTISQTFSTIGAAMVFGPPMQFLKVVKYTYKISGLDLAGVNPSTLDFVFIDANGNMYPVEYDYIAMDVNSGTLKVAGAKLNHFSRYGFVN
jgi:hypothetical protein